MRSSAVRKSALEDSSWRCWDATRWLASPSFKRLINGLDFHVCLAHKTLFSSAIVHPQRGGPYALTRARMCLLGEETGCLRLGI